MRKIIMMLVFTIAICTQGYAQQEWKDIGGDFVDVTTIAADSIDPEIIYAGTNRFVFKTKDGGKSWKSVLSVKGDYTRVNFLKCIDDLLFAATGNGLYLSADQGLYWEKVFKGKDELERNCLCAAAAGNKFFLGTQQGLFFTGDGEAWNKAKGELEDREIRFVIANPLNEDILYAMNPNILYKTKNNGGAWDKIYIFPSTYEDESRDYTPWDSEEVEPRNLKAIAINPNLPHIIYLATKSGILKSEDAGESWQAFSNEGLPKEVRYLEVFNGEIIAATEQGVFEYSQGKWNNIYKGMSKDDAYWVAAGPLKNVFAATSAGVFRLDTENLDYTSKYIPDELKKFFDKEPTIIEIQKRAISYNDVDNRKIADWRRRMRMRALMPDISLNYNKSVYGTAGSSTYDGKGFVGPRDWGVSFGWDLAEFVWNSYEDDIDSRGRYMVQLRDDILDEVTRLYFERRRLQVELLTCPVVDEKQKLDRDLRLQELTANIDALTGGYLSKMAAEID